MSKYVSRVSVCGLVIGVLLSHVGYTQTHWFRHYSNTDGLSHNQVNCSVQDQHGFIWFGTLDGLNRFDGYNFKVFRTDTDQPGAIGNNFVSALYRDRTGTLWVGTHNGLWRYDESRESFSRLDFTFTKWIFEITDDAQGNLWFICLGQLVKYEIATGTHRVFDIELCHTLISGGNDEIWVGTSTGLVVRHNPKSGSMDRIPVFDRSPAAASLQINKLYHYQRRWLLVGTQDQGLKIVDLETSTYRDVPLGTKNGQKLAVMDIVQPEEGIFWIGTADGIYVYDFRSETAYRIKRGDNEPNTLSDNYVEHLNIDKDGGIWISCRHEGINYFDRNNDIFTHHFPEDGTGKRLIIVQVVPDGQGDLWIATENQGIYFFDHRRKTMTRRHHAHTGIASIMATGNELWIGKGVEGLEVIDARTGNRIPRYDSLTKNNPDIKGTTRFSSLFKTRDAVLAGTTEGIFRYDSAANRLNPVEGIPKLVVSCVYEDRQGGVWVGSHYSGLHHIPPGESIGVPMNLDFSDDGRYNNTVTSITEDAQGVLWISTEANGIARYQRETKELTFARTDRGLPSNNTFKLLRGSDNALWVSTAAGLGRINLATDEIQTFTSSNGLPFDQFNYNAGFAVGDGTLYFGATRGLVSFNEADVTEREAGTALFITGIQVENHELLIDSGSVSLTNSIIKTDELVLPYDRSSISLDVAALSFRSPQMTQYRYILEGLENTWTDMKTNRKIYFSKLPPGKYLFRARAAVANGHWDNERTLSITITPPWWQSAWAYTAYLLTVSALGYLVVRYYMGRAKERNARLIHLLNHEKNKEIYEAKIDFFTNVAHEIRTPLTLIVAPIEKIEQADSLEAVKSNLPLLQRNADRLIALTNQLLDFRKIEQKNLKLNFVKTSVNDLLNTLFNEFKLAAERKGLRYMLLVDADKINAFVDPEALRKILSNLFHNATKYARTKILVTLSQPDENTFSIKLSNDGEPIPTELREKVFEPFYRSNSTENTQGTGIGLAMARSLATLHHGNLAMDPSNELIEFVLTLPIHQELGFDFEVPTDEKEKAEHHTPETDDGDKKKRILVVEDSEDILGFLYNELHNDYQVHTAMNGAAALEVLQETSINLIVSDVMMPGMDGFALCSHVKSDVNLSHIPVILLTAKNNISAKVEGLALGADAYIEKPFSPTHVKAQIANLLQNRERLLERFATSTAAPIGSIAVSKTDDVFLNKLNDIILENIGNADLDVDYLADKLFMSRRNLYRKMKAVSGVAPLEMITIIRLKKAAELLVSTDLKVYEIALHTGFKSPDTFTRNFIRQFGKSPSEFSKSPL